MSDSGNRDRNQTWDGNKKVNRNSSGVMDGTHVLPFLSQCLNCQALHRRSGAAVPAPLLSARSRGKAGRHLSAYAGRILNNCSSKNTATREFLGQRGKHLLISRDFCTRWLKIVFFFISVSACSAKSLTTWDL